MRPREDPIVVDGESVEELREIVRQQAAMIYTVQSMNETLIRRVDALEEEMAHLRGELRADADMRRGGWGEFLFHVLLGPSSQCSGRIVVLGATVPNCSCSPWYSQSHSFAGGITAR